MRHYEIVFLVHPDQSEHVPAMIDRYRNLIEGSGGAVHRLEDWGRRQLAFMIAGVYKAHYVLINIEWDGATLSELNRMFKFSDAGIRTLVIRKDRAITAASPLVKSKEEDRSDHASTSSDSGDQQQVASAAVEIPRKESDNLSDDPPTLVDKEDTETADQKPIVGNNSTGDEDAAKEKT